MSVPEAGHTVQRRIDAEQLFYEKTTSRHSQDVGAASHRSGDGDVETLTWDGPEDKDNPVNWSKQSKWLLTGTALVGTLIAPLNGTSITVAAEQINMAFGVSDTSFPNSYWPVTSWTVGGAISVVLLLPVMEDLGVKTGFIVTYAFFLLMILPQALARNFTTLIITRFFSGGCVTLLANVISSMIPDLYEDDNARSVPVGLYVLVYMVGNTLGPPMFAPVMQFLDTWRWIFYIQLIFYGALFPVFIFLIKETRGNVILRRRAKQLRKKTGRQIYTVAELDAPPLQSRLVRSATRPMYLLFTEPVLLAGTCWSSFSFGTVFLFTQSTGQVFTELYGWEAYSAGYVQAAVIVGEILGWVATFFSTHWYLQSATRNVESPGRPIPEARLYVSTFGSFAGVAGGMFVYAWTSYPEIPWIAPAIGLAMVGFGIQTVESAVVDYILDAYATSDYAGSAISGIAFGENMFAGFLPLAATKMYTELGFQWASSLLGFLALLLSFAPVIFIWKGKTLRARSPFMLSGRQRMEDKARG